MTGYGIGGARHSADIVVTKVEKEFASLFATYARHEGATVPFDSEPLSTSVGRRAGFQVPDPVSQEGLVPLNVLA